VLDVAPSFALYGATSSTDYSSWLRLVFAQKESELRGTNAGT
jgi:hypothetical protein